jgi:hypothetical protein
LSVRLPCDDSNDAHHSGRTAAPAARGLRRCRAVSSGKYAGRSEAANMASGAALRADARAALAELSKVPAEEFRGNDEAFRRCMLKRFDRDSVPDTVTDAQDSLARDASRIYQQYWWQVLRTPFDRIAAETRFAERLAAMMAEPPPRDEDSMDALQEKLNVRLRERGFHPLQGRTLPLYDLFLWRTQLEKDFDVELPAGEVERVRVHLMDDFVSRGWSSHDRPRQGVVRSPVAVEVRGIYEPVGVVLKPGNSSRNSYATTSRLPSILPRNCRPSTVSSTSLPRTRPSTGTVRPSVRNVPESI